MRRRKLARAVCVILAIPALQVFRLNAQSYSGDDGRQSMNQGYLAAIKGNDLGIHGCFIAAYVRASLPYLGGEDEEEIVDNLGELLVRCGDERVSRMLAIERPEVQSAVKLWIGFPPMTVIYRLDGQTTAPWKKYPKTAAILNQAPKMDFPCVDGSPQFQAFRKILKD
jgi:hypothetical protein